MSIVVNGITTKNVVFNGKDVKKVCNETDKIIFTKTFGKVWKVSNSNWATADASFGDCVFGNGFFLVPLGNELYKSEDGVNWSLVLSAYVSKLSYANGYFFATYRSSLYKSEDGVNWTKITTYSCCNVIYAKGYWITGYSGCLMYSKDCNIWNTLTLSGMSKSARFNCANNIIFLCLESGSSFYLDDDFSAHRLIIDGSQTTNYVIDKILYKKGVFVGISSFLLSENYEPDIFYSEDGMNWTRCKMGLGTSRYTDLCFYNNCFLAMNFGQVYKSEDGMNWTLYFDGLSIDNIIYEKGVYVAGRYENEKKLLYSDDCENWIESEIVKVSSYLGRLSRIVYGKDRFVCVPGGYGYGEINRILYSE